MSEEELIITIPLKEKKVSEKNTNDNIIGFVEIKNEHIKHLHGSWLKFSQKYKTKIYTGGFLDKIIKNTAYLRCPSKENITVEIDDHVFYVKESNDNYASLLELLKSHRKDIHELVFYKKNIIQMIKSGKLQFKK